MLINDKTVVLPVSPEELVALLEAVVEQHVDALQSHLSIIYVLCLLLYLLLLLLLRTRHCFTAAAQLSLLDRTGALHKNWI